MVSTAFLLEHYTDINECVYLFYLFVLSFNHLLLCSLSHVSGNEKLNSDNITRILDRLLDGYDNRLRPGSGGDSVFKARSLIYHKKNSMHCIPNKSCVHSAHCKDINFRYRWCHRGENGHLCHKFWTCFRCWDGEILVLQEDVCAACRR